jgi:hypothetical protein
MQNIFVCHQLLRTCSEPDMTRLFRSLERVLESGMTRHGSMEKHLDDDDHDLTAKGDNGAEKDRFVG